MSNILELQLLQYNMQKFKNKVTILLLTNSYIQSFQILVIQKL